MERPIYIIGDSHAAAISAGLRKLKLENVISSRTEIHVNSLGNGAYLHTDFYSHDDQSVTLTRDDYRASLEKLIGISSIKRGFEGCFGLSMGFHSPRIFRQPIWKKFSPWQVAQRVELPALSENLYNSIFEKNNTPIFRFLEALRSIDIDVFVIPAPPPRRSHPALLSGTHPDVVKEVDRLFRKWVAAELDHRQIKYLELPADTIAPDGFLKLEFEPSNAADQHHANADYGTLVIQQIMGLLNRS